MLRTKNKVLTIRTTAEAKTLLKLTLSESLYAAMSPNNNRPLRYETKLGNSFK